MGERKVFQLSKYHFPVSFPVSEPMIFDDDDLRVIISALKATRKTRGSIRADNIIRLLEYQLAHPDTHIMNVDEKKVEIPFA